MKYYEAYMKRQRVSAGLHERLLGMERSDPLKRAKPWIRYGALAACCALALGLGIWRFAAPENQTHGQPAGQVQSPGTQGIHGPGTVPPEDGFVVERPDGGKLMVPAVPYIYYQDLTAAADAAASIALPEGSFETELTPQDIQTIFWGPGGGPEGDQPKQEQAALPWMLFWEGYTVTGRALYDGEGRLFWLHLWGEHPGGAEFTLELSPGRLPPSCLVDPDCETTDVKGTAVTGWSRTYDRDGDGVTDVICGSEFMAGEIGVRFENVGSPVLSEYGGQTDLALGGAAQFNALFVRQALAEDGGLYLNHLLVNENIPAWREQEFSSLAQARGEEAYAPYLPTADVPGYGDFYGCLSYQEGDHSYLFVRWSRGYDDVEVDVRLPEGGETDKPVDISNPASYDTRLYEIPWGSTVPQEYQADFYLPYFRAEDMSLAVVEARGTQKDTGGLSYRFGVIYENGVVVEYHCSGLTAAQVWAMVEETLG